MRTPDTNVGSISKPFCSQEESHWWSCLYQEEEAEEEEVNKK